jgi:hypothetical protein
MTSLSAIAAWLVLGLGCIPEPLPLPTEAAVQALDRDVQPPLYQMLYDAPALPGSKALQQRVRILIWLKHLQLDTSQLSRLEELRGVSRERGRRIHVAEEALAQRWEPQENGVYTRLWDGIIAGTSLDDPAMGKLTEELREMRAGGEREREMLKLRLQGIRAVLEAQRPFLATLSPTQEALLADAVFFLRNRLDPIGNPGDFRALVGSIYDPGQYAVLTRGNSEWARAHLNIGALWSDAPPVEGGALHEARREVLLYLILMEPGLREAIAAAKTIAEAQESEAAAEQ